MVNKVIFQGRFTADPELKTTSGGFSTMEFTLAWSEKYKEAETKCFLRCKAWRNTAEFISKYFSKGSQAVVEGQLTTEEWEKDGQKQSRTILTVEKIHFAGSKESTLTHATSEKPTDDFMDIPEGIDEELPFN